MKISLKLLRVSNDLTIQEVVEKTGLSFNTIVRLEKDWTAGLTSSLITLYELYGYELLPKEKED